MKEVFVFTLNLIKSWEFWVFILVFAIFEIIASKIINWILKKLGDEN